MIQGIKYVYIEQNLHRIRLNLSKLLKHHRKRITLECSLIPYIISENLLLQLHFKRKCMSQSSTVSNYSNFRAESGVESDFY